MLKYAMTQDLSALEAQSSEDPAATIDLSQDLLSDSPSSEGENAVGWEARHQMLPYSMLMMDSSIEVVDFPPEWSQSYWREKQLTDVLAVSDALGEEVIAIDESSSTPDLNSPILWNMAMEPDSSVEQMPPLDRGIPQPNFRGGMPDSGETPEPVKEGAIVPHDRCPMLAPPPMHLGMPMDVPPDGFMHHPGRGMPQPHFRGAMPKPGARPDALTGSGADTPWVCAPIDEASLEGMDEVPLLPPPVFMPAVDPMTMAEPKSFKEHSYPCFHGRGARIDSGAKKPHEGAIGRGHRAHHLEQVQHDMPGSKATVGAESHPSMPMPFHQDHSQTFTSGLSHSSVLR
jgi:hypothetical protein